MALRTTLQVPHLPKPAFAAAATLQRLLADQSCAGRAPSDNGTYALRYTPAGGGDASFALWSLAAPAANVTARQTGEGHNSSCADPLAGYARQQGSGGACQAPAWHGMPSCAARPRATYMRCACCVQALCAATAGCHSFVTRPLGGCALFGGRCVAPAYSADCGGGGCSGVQAFTLLRPPAPMPLALPGCRDAYDLAGARP